MLVVYIYEKGFLVNKCSVCENEFEDQDFDAVQNKCILHSEKIYLSQIDDDNSKIFYDALRNYITPQVLRSSKEYKLAIDPMEHQQLVIWNFLDNIDNDDQTINIKEALKNKITLKDIIFPTHGSLNREYDYVNVLNKLAIIEFKNCKFEDEILLNDEKNLSFRRCTFTGDWHHIICKEITYRECKFENFVIENPSEDKFIVENHLLYNCGFTNIRCSGTKFKKRLFKFNNINEYKKIETIELTHCEFEEDFILTITENDNKEDKEDKEYFEVTSINFEHSIFNGKVKLQYCDIKEKANFYNTKFKDLADFYRTKFNEVVFERTDFEAVSVFSEAIFFKDLNFKYAKFLGYTVLRDTVIKGKFDLRNTIFDAEADANFLDITSEERKRDQITQEFYGEPKVIQVANRETARLIKSFYEYSNNIIESNKFYALEMKEREKELDKSFKDRKNLIEWAIFKLHGLSSNHSQDPVTPILWVLNIAYIYSMWISRLHLDNILGYFAAFIPFIGIFTKNKFLYKAILAGNLIFPYLFSFVTLAIIADKINPFSIMTSKDPITFGLLLFKVTIAYLIYQFIVSVRQNTRRK